MATTYSTTLNNSQSNVNYGDGDESSFAVAESGGSLSVSVAISGTSVSGSGTASSNLSGYAIGDTDGDDNSFSDSGSGNVSVGGTLSNVNIDGTLNDGETISFAGSFNGAQNAITGTIEIDDPNGNLAIPLSFGVTLNGSSPPPPPPPPPPGPPPPPAINSPSQLGQGQSVAESQDSLTGNIVNGFNAVFQTAVAAWQGSAAAAQAAAQAGIPKFLIGVDSNGVIGFRLPPVQTAAEAADSAFNAVGNAVGFGAVAVNVFQAGQSAYQTYQQTGDIATAAQKASIELSAAMGTGLTGILVGNIATWGASAAVAAADTLGIVAAGVTATTTAPLILGVAVGGLASFYLGNRAQALINTAYASGTSAALGQLNQSSFWTSLNTNAIPPSLFSSDGTSLITTASSVSSFTSPFNNIPFTFSSAEPQAEWTYNLNTGTFTWNDPSTQGMLTQVLSQMGVTQLAAPLNLSGSNTIIMGGSLSNTLSVGSGGNDWIIGGTGNNLINSGPGANFLEGGAGAVNTLSYSGAPSRINVNLTTDMAANGWGGTDTFTDFQIIDGSHSGSTFEAGPGSYTINGGGGLNTMVYTGARSSYAFSQSGSAAVVSDQRGGSPNGTDALNGIDQLRFSSGVLDTAYDFDGGGTSGLLLRNSANGQFEVYDIANNTITFARSMGQVGLEWQIAGLGDFTGSGGTDMLMRNVHSGAFEVYDIANNAITFAAGMGQVGLEWTVAGFGDFTGSGLSDMLMRNIHTGAFEFYDIANNTITAAGGMGQVGLEWQVAGFGDFAGDGTTDMLMRNSNTGQFEVYDISNNQIAFATGMGQVGLEWQVAGFGDFAGNGTSDMLMRNTHTGQFEVYDISSNRITSAAGMGQVGLEWQVIEFGTFAGDFTADMLMQNVNTGQFEVYDISNNRITSAVGMGQVGTQWVPSGPSNLAGVATAQITQAMAAFAPAGGAVPMSQQIDQPTLQASTASLLVTPGNQRPGA